MNKRIRTKVIYIALLTLCTSYSLVRHTNVQASEQKQLQFTANFDDNKNLPTWNNGVEVNDNVTGFTEDISPECSLRANEPSIGKNIALMYSGFANGGSSTRVVFKSFSVDIPVTKSTILDYWIYPEYENGKFVSVDLHFTDGTTLNESPAVDQKGFSVAPSIGHGNIPLYSWSEINSNIGKWFEGKVIDEILVAYDKAESVGPFRGYLDNISIGEGAVFSTGFESNEVQPVAYNYPESNNNITGLTADSQPVCATVSNISGHNGNSALRYEGTANGDKENNIMYRLFEEKMQVTEDMSLDYWILPEQENGRYVGIDFLCTDGTTLRDSGTVDENGQSVHPGAGHGGNLPLNSWSEISSNFGKYLKGKTIDSIYLVYDHYGAKGQFSGYLDDIKIYNGSSDVTVGPSDPDIKYFGRWDNSSSSTYNSYFGGTYFKVNFTGTSVKLKLAGPSNIYVNIDNGKDVAYNNVSGIVDLSAQPLNDGEHTLRVASKSQNDEIRFQGLILGKGAETRQPAVSNNLIEFIGDSITEGYTNSKESLSSYAWKTAEKLNSEHTQIAYVGICLSNDLKINLSHNIGMSTNYFKLQPTDSHQYSPDWDFKKYTPNIVVVNLGTNDFYAKVSEDKFQNNYETFLKNIRDKYPSSEIFVLRTFGTPNDKEGFLKSPTLNAVNTRISAGDEKLHFIDTAGWLNQKSEFTDGRHPSEDGNNKVAEKLSEVLRPYLIY